MKCEDFRTQIGEGQSLAGTAAIQHLELCSECRALAHADQSLRQRLAAVRESAPPVPATLDASVTAAYRARVAGRTAAASRIRSSRPLVLAAVAASVAIALVLVITHKKPHTTRETVAGHASSSTTVSTESPKERVAAAPVRRMSRTHAHVQRPARTEAPAAMVARETPTNGFQNLMFCDPLSCPGPMQVIRIQVPASAMNRVPAWRPAGGMVQADVVVGSDGIARAIRIVR